VTVSGSEREDPPALTIEAAGTAEGRGRLRDRRVLVVGAGTRDSDDADAPVGNGRAISVLAAREGASVACADRVGRAAQATADIISAEGGQAVVVVGDVARADACAQIVDDAIAAMGGLDGLVLNVGIGQGMTLEGTTAAAWDLTFAVNLRAHFLVTRSALPRMEPGGSVVFISSVAGLQPGSQLPAYDASKAGLFGLSRHVALEGARRGIRANVVVPGLIDTPMGRFASAGRPSRARTRIPLGRQGTGWEIAYATIFLLSAEASYITGQSVVVDGGLSALA
jgi:NAD(P)-dependent dehydrogenase (short-subunit alcohol dehydrogenase family)